jgi:hypothetical protein
VEAHPEDGFIVAHVSPPQRSHPQEIQLRLRHPEGKSMLKVEVNGRSWNKFDPQNELIALPVDQGELGVRAYYR